MTRNKQDKQVAGGGAAAAAASYIQTENDEQEIQTDSDDKVFASCMTKLPQLLWSSSIFNCKISNLELELMTTEDLMNIPTYQTTDEAGQLRRWLCLLLGHTKDPVAVLLAVAKKLSLSPTVIFKGAILSNRQDLLNHLDINTAEIKSVISNDLYELVAGLNYERSFEILNVVVPLQLQEDQLKSNIFNILEAAACNNSLHILEWFKINCPDELCDRIGRNNWLIHLLPVASDHITVLKWFKQEMSDQSLFNSYLCSASYGACGLFARAVYDDNSEVLAWLKEEIQDHFQLLAQADRYSFFRDAVEKNHLNVLTWFKTEMPVQFNEMIHDCISLGATQSGTVANAAKEGLVNVLAWLKSEIPQAQFQPALEDAFFQAAEHGRVNVLNWLRTEMPIDRFQVMLNAFVERTGNIAYWFKRSFAHSSISVPATTIDRMNLHYKTKLQLALNWFKAEISEEQFQVMLGRAFLFAAEYGLLEILSQFKTEIPENQFHTIIRANNYCSIYAALEIKNDETINWFKIETPEAFQIVTSAIEQRSAEFIKRTQTIYVAEHEAEVPEQYQDLKNKFYANIQSVRLKYDDLRLRGYELEAGYADTLAEFLKTKGDLFFAETYQTQRSSFSLFKRQCSEEILKAKDWANIHRGYTQIFIDILQSLTLIGVILGAMQWSVTGKYSLFSVQTDSSTMLHVISGDVNQLGRVLHSSSKSVSYPQL